MIQIKADGGTAKIDLFASSGAALLSMNVLRNNPTIALRYPDRKPGLIIRMERSAIPTIGLLGKDGSSMLVMSHDSSRKASAFGIYHDSKPLFVLGIASKRGSALRLSDYKTGKTAQIIVSEKESLMGLQTASNDESLYAGLSIDRQTPKLSIAGLSNSKIDAYITYNGEPHFEIIRKGFRVGQNRD